MLHTWAPGANRVSLCVEQLEDRQVMSVFVTPPIIPAASLLHHHKHGVITVHIRGDDTPDRTLLSSFPHLTETFSSSLGSFSLSPRAVGAKGNELELKFSRSAIASHLGGAKVLSKLTGDLLVTVMVSNGSGTTESSSFVIRARHPHAVHPHS